MWNTNLDEIINCEKFCINNSCHLNYLPLLYILIINREQHVAILSEDFDKICE